ncbi:HNH endonuclease [Ferriphaselus amnicola]|uniref:HNH endonuclease n=1 Tax=Ferriphaselus amnicola TaxID=1188319 RepID=UPI0009FB9A66
MPTTRLTKNRNSAFVRQSGLCHYCNFPMWQGDSSKQYAQAYGLSLTAAQKFQCTAEHLLARQDGGTDYADNIVAACRYCNQKRHKRKMPAEPSSFRQLVQNRVRRGKWFCGYVLDQFRRNGLLSHA